MKNTIQTKRNAKAGSGFRKLHAKTTARKRKLRAATAMDDAHVDFASDVPNVGIGRALIVILAIHVVAIAAIYLHSTFFGKDVDKVVDSQQATPITTVLDETESKPELESVTATSGLVAPAAESDYSLGRHAVDVGAAHGQTSDIYNVDQIVVVDQHSNSLLGAGQESPSQRMTSADNLIEDLAEPSYPRAIVVDEEVSSPVAVLVRPIKTIDNIL